MTVNFQHPFDSSDQICQATCNRAYKHCSHSVSKQTLLLNGIIIIINRNNNNNKKNYIYIECVTIFGGEL